MFAACSLIRSELNRIPIKSRGPIKKTSHLRLTHLKSKFLLWWRCAQVGQEYQPKIRLFEATVSKADKMEFIYF